jgi:hypothetical protein
VRSVGIAFHRYTLNRLRAEIAPVSPAEFHALTFLFAVDNHVGRTAIRLTRHRRGQRGRVIAQLDGLELPARTWETCDDAAGAARALRVVAARHAVVWTV